MRCASRPASSTQTWACTPELRVTLCPPRRLARSPHPQLPESRCSGPMGRRHLLAAASSSGRQPRRGNVVTAGLSLHWPQRLLQQLVGSGRAGACGVGRGGSRVWRTRGAPSGTRGRVARCVITLAVVSAPGLKRKFSRPCLRGWGSDRGAGTGCMRGFQGPLQGCGEQRPAPLHCDPEAPKTRAPLGGPTLAFNRRAWGWPSRAPRPAVRWGSGWGSGCQKHQLGLNYGFPGRFGQCQPQRVYRREL